MEYKIGDNIVASGTPAEIAEFLRLRQYKAPEDASPKEAPEITLGRKAAEAEAEKRREYQRKYHLKQKKLKNGGLITGRRKKHRGVSDDPEIERLRRKKIGDSVRARCAARKAAEAAANQPVSAQDAAQPAVPSMFP